MSISIVANLHPHGNRSDERWLATININTTADLEHHYYCIMFRKRTICGTLKKDKSAHRNLLHVLRAVLADPAIDKLKPDYIKTPKR